MQKVTKKIKAAAIAPRAQPGQRTGNSLMGLGLALGVEALRCLGVEMVGEWA